MVKFVYIDETGTVDLDDAAQPQFQLHAAVIREDQVRPLTESIHGILGRYLGAIRGRELHGYDMFHGIGDWSGVSPVARIEAYREALALLEKHDIATASVAINKPALKARYPQPESPYLLALQFLCEKVDALGPDLKVLVADEAKEHRTRAIQMVGDLQNLSHGAVPGRKLKTIIDTLHFVRSHENAGVQMIDLVAFIRQRRRSKPESPPELEVIMEEFSQTVLNSLRTFRWAWPR